MAYLNYVFGLAAAWWLVVGGVALVQRRHLVRQPLPQAA
jgi:hypothetical protein